MMDDLSYPLARLTVFSPTDDAFEDYLDDLGDTKSKGFMENPGEVRP